VASDQCLVKVEILTDFFDVYGLKSLKNPCRFHWVKQIPKGFDPPPTTNH
jgi:hypothetical protein